MSFRRRITLASAAAVAIAVVLASLLVYVLTADELHSQVDNQLRSHARETSRLKRLFAAAAEGRHRRRGEHRRSTRRARSRSRPRRPKATSTRSGAEGGPTRPTAATGPRSAALRPGINAAPGSLFGQLPPNPDQVRGYQQVVEPTASVLARSVAERDAAGRPAHRAARRARRRTVLPQRDRRRRAPARARRRPSGATAREQLALPLSRSRQPAEPLRLILFLRRDRRHRPRRAARPARRGHRGAPAEAPHADDRARHPHPGPERADRRRPAKTRSAASRAASTRCSTRWSAR